MGEYSAWSQCRICVLDQPLSLEIICMRLQIFILENNGIVDISAQGHCASIDVKPVESVETFCNGGHFAHCAVCDHLCYAQSVRII